MDLAAVTMSPGGSELIDVGPAPADTSLVTPLGGG